MKRLSSRCPEPETAMRVLRFACLFGLAALTLASCTDVREDLGLGRATPDEFAVVDRPPLSMPPDFGLKPPEPGAPRPQEVDMSQRANDVLFGPGRVDHSLAAASPAATPMTAAPIAPVVASGGASPAEAALLAQTGADKADPNIRTEINREASEKTDAPKHLVEDLLWWKKEPSQATTVDASAEAARIKQDQDSGKPINAGATPVIEREKSGWLGL
jgi:hypothetical protein